jgi:tetratricopeptide (TPR) repeat protein
MLCPYRRCFRVLLLSLFVLGLPRVIAQDDVVNVSPARAKMYEAMVEVQDGKYESAIPKLEAVIAEDPTLLGAWETLGWAYWLTDRRKEAEDLWTRLVGIAPNEPLGYNLLAQIATRDADFVKAEQLYENSLRINPAQFEIRLNYGRVLLWSGKRDKAVAIFRTLFQEDPERIDVEIDLAWALYANEEYEESLVHWNHINEMVPDQPGFLLARANVLVLIGALPEAEIDCRRVLELEPDNPDAVGMLVQLSIRNNRPRESIKAMEDLMDLTEDDVTRSLIAQQLAGYKQSIFDQSPDIVSRKEVVAAGKKAWDLDRENVGAALFYGEALVGDKQFSEAASVFQFVLDELNPNNFRARQGLMETYFGRSMLDEAEKQLRENLRVFNPDDPYRHVYWSRLYFSRGNLLEAMRSLERLEYEGAQGAVFTLLYHGISPSEFSDMPSVRQLREQLMALRRAGYTFITPSQLPLYFDNKKAPTLTDERPWLNRLTQSIRYAWTGRRAEEAPRLSDYSPEKVVMVTFDDGRRNSFRYGSQVAEELNIPMTMFVSVGGVVSREQRYVAQFAEIREWQTNGLWEIQSQLWEASQMVPAEKEGRPVLPLPNLIWKTDRDRKETLREYHQRLRREFRDSKRVLAREMGLEPDDIQAVAYPFGEVGQEHTSNINLFNVTEILLNEAEISYKMGFVQSRHGYSIKTDNALLYKRYEPARSSSGRDVLRAAYLQHPVFVARRMRVEMAALSGQLHLANDNIELLRRDGYPEEDLALLQAYVKRHLARLVALPDAVEDTAATPVAEKEKLIRLQDPYIGVDGRNLRANVVIDERELGIFAGLNLNRRSALQVRYGLGAIKQTNTTNRFVEVEKTSTSTSREIVQTVEDGVVSNTEETRTAFETVTIQSNVVERTKYDADFTNLGLLYSYIHDSGSFTIARAGLYTLNPDGGEDEEDGEASNQAFTYGLEHQWRPFPAMDISSMYTHGVVPSAREVITYDQLALRPFWRIRDGWQTNGIGSFAFYEDRNSHVRVEMENFWRMSQAIDLWLGFHNSIDTTDRDSDIYWSPYWEQRHYFILRLRRSYPNYFGMFKANVGVMKSRARQAELDLFDNSRVQGETQGFSPGSGPDEDWNPLLGFSASVTRSWDNGWNITGEFSVNSSKEYTEHTVSGSLLYKF